MERGILMSVSNVMRALSMAVLAMVVALACFAQVF
jgi:hypothetical protein